MKLLLETLVLFCKQSEERVQFSPSLSFFHGEMSTGKSTIAVLVDYCLGGGLQKTPAIQSELVGVQLQLVAGDVSALIERNPSANSSVEVTWEGDDVYHENLPLAAAEQPVIGDDIYNFSDFLLRHVGAPVLKVRKRKGDPDSALQRLSFRDFYKFCYLDQPDLDSSFFLLEQPIRMEKSKDVLRYVLGFHSDRLNELQNELSEVRQSQRTMRESAKQLDEFLQRYEFNSKDRIGLEIDRLNDEEEKLEAEIESQGNVGLPDSTVVEEDQHLVNDITEQIVSKTEAVSEIAQKLNEQESLIAEFIAMKLKLVRSSTASELLKGAEFQVCPVCGTDVAARHDEKHCVLCKSDLDKAPGWGGFEANIIMERDLSERIDDLKRSVQRLKRSHEKQCTARQELTKARAEAQTRVDFARKRVESEYMKRARQLEARRGAIKERRSLLMRIRGMPDEVEGKLSEADKLSAKIAEFEREIQSEQSRFEEGRSNVRALEQNFHRLLMAIHFPEMKEDDKVFLNQRTWFPYVHPKGNEGLAWTFSDAGSGGKMVLFKICFALALHLTAAKRDLPIPRIMVIDSPMKNITPDINPEIFSFFYRELFRLLENELKTWQCVVIDQTYFEPPEGFERHTQRLLTKDDPHYPPLISYYHGH